MAVLQLVANDIGMRNAGTHRGDLDVIEIQITMVWQIGNLVITLS